MKPCDLPDHLTLHGPPVPPKFAARRLARAVIKGEFTPAALHEYTDADGRAIYWRIRARLADGSKWMRPMRVRGMVYELGEPDFGDKLKPLYRLHEIATANRERWVFFVEGEKCADALAKLGAPATTAGSAQSDDRADFTPLQGRRVIVWADRDDPGREHGQRVAAKLRALGCTVEMVDIDALALPEHGDVCDYLAAHPNATAVDLMAVPRLSGGEATAATERMGPRVELLRADAVKIEPVRWLWEGWLARGKLHILAGAPGTGKTTLALGFAATLTVGGRFPDGARCDLGDVLIWSGEDDPADTLAPRLAAMGADLKRVHFVASVHDAHGRRAFNPSTDVAPLLDTLRGGVTPRLVIVDPIVNAIAGDSHKNAEVRQGLAPLVELAAEIDCALLGISHFTKGTAGRDPVERVTGSLAFGALARVVLAAAKKPEDQGGGRLLARAKSNIGPDGGGFAYSIDVVAVPNYPTVQATRVLWGESVQGTARELLADAEIDTDAGGEQRDAADWLRDLLAAGPMDSNEVRRAADANGISWATLRRAKKRIGAESEKAGMSGGWSWFLPKVLKDAEDAQEKYVSTFGESEHLRESEAIGREVF